MKSDAVFIPSNRLEQQVHAGSFDGVIAVLRAMPQAQRGNHRAAMRDIRKRLSRARWDPTEALLAWWGGAATGDQYNNLDAALFFCGDGKDRGDAWNERLYPHLDMLEASELRRLASDLAAAGRWRATGAQRLVQEGLSDRPDSDDYAVMLIAAPSWTRDHTSLLQMIEADPGLLDGPLLRLFEVEGTSDINMAAVEKYAYGKNTWSEALLELVRSGKLDRDLMIDQTLSTLEKDWPQFRAGWFSRFHDKLAPGADEMAPRAARYLGLCQSRIAPTVTLALSSLTLMLKAERLETAPLLDALVPVMSSAVKGQVETALKLLDMVVKKDPSRSHAASALAQLALAHESADVHAKVLARLAGWGFDDGTRTALEAMLPFVAAAHRDTLSRLAGVGAAPERHATPDTLAACGIDTGLMSALDPARRLAPIMDIDELVQTIASVLENDCALDDFERALEGLARMHPQLQAERGRFAAVLKRARKIAANERTLATALGRLLAFAIDGEPVGRPGDGIRVRHELDRRIADLATFMAQGCALTPLSCATHARGFIDPLELAGRIGSHDREGVQSPLAEQVRSLLRLAPAAGGAALAMARALAPSEFSRALRYALGDDLDASGNPALFHAAARIRHPGADDERLLAAFGDTGPDGARAATYDWLMVTHDYDGGTYDTLELQLLPASGEYDPLFIAMRRHQYAQYGDSFWSGSEGDWLYAASVLPGCLDACFAYGALNMGRNLEWSEVSWEDKAYLSLLLDRATPLGRPAARLLAFALGGKEPGHSAMAIDALVAVVLEGRGDVMTVAHHIRADALSGRGKCARYAKHLASAARAAPAMPAKVRDMLCAILDFGDASAPKDTARLLDLLLELLLGNSLELPAGARDALGRLQLSGKAKATRDQVLARCA